MGTRKRKSRTNETSSSPTDRHYDDDSMHQFYSRLSDQSPVSPSGFSQSNQSNNFDKQATEEYCSKCCCQFSFIVSLLILGLSAIKTYISIHIEDDLAHIIAWILMLIVSILVLIGDILIECCCQTKGDISKRVKYRLGMLLALLLQVTIALIVVLTTPPKAQHAINNVDNKAHEETRNIIIACFVYAILSVSSYAYSNWNIIKENPNIELQSLIQDHNFTGTSVSFRKYNIPIVILIIMISTQPVFAWFLAVMTFLKNFPTFGISWSICGLASVIITYDNCKAHKESCKVDDISPKTFMELKWKIISKSIFVTSANIFLLILTWLECYSENSNPLIAALILETILMIISTIYLSFMAYIFHKYLDMMIDLLKPLRNSEYCLKCKKLF
ncbi:MAG: hypothetical protein MHMPM18_001991 [Marteilia pararefringens]